MSHVVLCKKETKGLRRVPSTLATSRLTHKRSHRTKRSELPAVGQVPHEDTFAASDVPSQLKVAAGHDFRSRRQLGAIYGHHSTSRRTAPIATIAWSLYTLKNRTRRPGGMCSPRPLKIKGRNLWAPGFWLPDMPGFLLPGCFVFPRARVFSVAGSVLFVPGMAFLVTRRCFLFRDWCFSLLQRWWGQTKKVRWAAGVYSSRMTKLWYCGRKGHSSLDSGSGSLSWLGVAEIGEVRRQSKSKEASRGHVCVLVCQEPITQANARVLKTSCRRTVQTRYNMSVSKFDSPAELCSVVIRGLLTSAFRSRRNPRYTRRGYSSEALVSLQSRGKRCALPRTPSRDFTSDAPARPQAVAWLVAFGNGS